MPTDLSDSGKKDKRIRSLRSAKHKILSPVERSTSGTMKLVIVLVSAVAVLSQEASAFAFTNVARPAAVCRNTLLRMNVEEREVKNVKVGVIGCGRIGLVHLEAITKAPGVTPVIVSNPTISKAEKGTSALNALLHSLFSKREYCRMLY